MRVVPLQEMQHAGEFVAAVRDLGARGYAVDRITAAGRFQPGEFGKPFPAPQRGSLMRSVRTSPSRSICSDGDPD
jgi:hypothetical protein